MRRKYNAPLRTAALTWAFGVGCAATGWLAVPYDPASGRPAWVDDEPSAGPCEVLAQGVGRAEVTHDVETARTIAADEALQRLRAALTRAQEAAPDAVVPKYRLLSEYFFADENGNPARINPVRVYARALACQEAKSPAALWEND